MGKMYLTFDVEEWRIPEHNGAKHPLNANTKFSREGTLKLLRLLRKHRIKATFFVTGYFAEREPGLVRQIMKEGHEIASHSYKDVSHYDLSPDEMKRSVERADRIIRSITGKKPAGFRTPQFSITPAMLKAIIRQSYRYDSSTNPVSFPHYRKTGVSFEKMTTMAMTEIPVSNMPLVRLPISWVCMRNVGLWWTNLGVWLNLRLGCDAVLYFHPWEFVELPRIKGVPFYITRKCGQRSLGDLEKLIIRFRKSRRNRFAMMKDLQGARSAGNAWSGDR